MVGGIWTVTVSVHGASVTLWYAAEWSEVGSSVEAVAFGIQSGAQSVFGTKCTKNRTATKAPTSSAMPTATASRRRMIRALGELNTSTSLLGSDASSNSPAATQLQLCVEYMPTTTTNQARLVG